MAAVARGPAVVSAGESGILTVMVSVREGHGLAEESLRTVLADAALPFDLIYVDILSPPDVAAQVARLCGEHGGRTIRHDRWIAPSAARKQALKDVNTRYVVFIDNDVAVAPGCFAGLVSCAEDTGAALVGPVYLQSGYDGPPTIHMAGGRLERLGGDDGPLTYEEHLLAAAPAEIADTLARRRVDSLEYHCMLARTDFIRGEGVISDEVLLAHEHMDVALRAEAAGFAVWVEPAARITYLGFRPRQLGDLPFFRRRWDLGACDASMAAFARTWPVADEAEFNRSARDFVGRCLDGVSLTMAAAPTEAMARSDLAQSRTDLREQAAAAGYADEHLRALEAGCDFATLLFDGVYRPDGRPFLSHVIGTASALVHYRLKFEIVLAGLLHAVYSHRPGWIAEADVTAFLSSGGKADQIVRALPRVKARLSDADRGGAVRADRLSLADAETLCVEAANEADMRLAGEYRACGRPAVIGEGALALFADALAYVDLPGLALSAAAPLGQGPVGQVLGFGAIHGSFRLNAAARRVDPVRSGG